jgi:hypothetical protein
MAQQYMGGTVKIFVLFSIWCLVFVNPGLAYPLDGYSTTGIRRLERLRLLAASTAAGVVAPVVGARKTLGEIKLNLLTSPGATLETLPPVEEKLQKRLDAIFPNRHESYSIALLDVTPGRPICYASRQPERLFSPGSVGKLAIAAGLFSELKALFPESTEAREKLLRETMVKAGRWVLGDSHTVPIFDPKTGKYENRTIREGDVFSLNEWVDYMLSASANAAASVVWREVMLIRACGRAYPPVPADAEAFFASTPKAELQKMALSVVNSPLRQIGIADGDWRLGSFFTGVGKAYVPSGGSHGNPQGLLWFLVRLEQGKVVDEWSSLEIKRFMYMTARRIRYASAPALTNGAVYFKSGSIYSHKPEAGFVPQNYAGNVQNFMNSVAIVEQPDGRVYFVVLMSNVLGKNSAADHQSIAAQVDGIIGK